MTCYRKRIAEISKLLEEKTLSEIEAENGYSMTFDYDKEEAKFKEELGLGKFKLDMLPC